MVQLFLRDGSNTNTRHELNVSKLTTIKQLLSLLKKKISEASEKKISWKEKKLRLLYGGRILDDLSLSVWHCELKEGSTIIYQLLNKPKGPQATSKSSSVAETSTTNEEKVIRTMLESAYPAQKKKDHWRCAPKGESDTQTDIIGIPSYLIKSRWIRLWHIKSHKDGIYQIRFPLPKKYRVEEGTSLQLLFFIDKKKRGEASFNIVSEAKSKIITEAKSKEKYIRFKFPEESKLEGYYTIGIQDDTIANEGCCICKRNNNPDKQILCDECDRPYHAYCLNPPITDFTSLDTWFCPRCENTEMKSKQNRKIEITDKKRNSKGANCNRTWGGGGSCSGLRRECTIVPPDHKGPIPGIMVGKHWKTRREVHEDGVHRSVVAGICGRSATGAVSICVSGRYSENNDKGDKLYYTGSGGRNLADGNRRTAAQTFDQTWERCNLALARTCIKFTCKRCSENMDSRTICLKCKTNWKQGMPVRVLRKHTKIKGKKKGQWTVHKYGPQIDNSLRYDGIYKVCNFWREAGESGHLVCRFSMKRDDPEPAPWTEEGRDRIARYNLDALAVVEDKTKGKNIPQKGKKRQLSLDSQIQSAKQAKLRLEQDVKESQKDKKEVLYLQGLINEDQVNKEQWKALLEKHSLALPHRKEFLESVLQSFSCSVCLDAPVRNPVVLSCGHGSNLCKECYARAITSQKSNQKICILCREKIDTSKTRNNNKLWEVLCYLFPHVKEK